MLFWDVYTLNRAAVRISIRALREKFRAVVVANKQCKSEIHVRKVHCFYPILRNASHLSPRILSALYLVLHSMSGANIHSSCSASYRVPAIFVCGCVCVCARPLYTHVVAFSTLMSPCTWWHLIRIVRLYSVDCCFVLLDFRTVEKESRLWRRKNSSHFRPQASVCHYGMLIYGVLVGNPGIRYSDPNVAAATQLPPPHLLVSVILLLIRSPVLTHRSRNVTESGKW